MIKPKKLSVEPSVHMMELINDSAIAKNISTIYPTLREILFQIGIDITNEENRDKVGPTILAIGHVLDVLTVFAAQGEKLISQEKPTK